MLLSACQTTPGPGKPSSPEPEFAGTLDALLPNLIKQEKVAGVGVAVIRDGKAVWEGYYGQQAPGVPVSNQTVFNTASIAKTITAETLLALYAKKVIDIDAPIADAVRHPDLSRDPRYAQLTTRLLLGHRAGLLNWAYSYEDGRLAFAHDPDTRFSYSGAGIELAARYAEAITGQELAKLAREEILEPADIREISLGVIPAWASDRLATPMDQAGIFRSVAELNESLAQGTSNGAADDLLATIPAYATFVEQLMESPWLPAELQCVRLEVATPQNADPVYGCPELDWLTCPEAYGHSFGWQAFHYPGHTVLLHSGSDAGENAFVYYSPEKRSGAVIFVNGANGWFLMTRIIEVIGDEPLLADYFRALISTVMGRDMPPLARTDFNSPG
ncbi:MAG: serine hydrolase domain-containing protein [Pseudomonadota bacterium]